MFLTILHKSSEALSHKVVSFMNRRAVASQCKSVCVNVCVWVCVCVNVCVFGRVCVCVCVVNVCGSVWSGRNVHFYIHTTWAAVKQNFRIL